MDRNRGIVHRVATVRERESRVENHADRPTGKSTFRCRVQIEVCARLCWSGVATCLALSLVQSSGAKAGAQAGAKAGAKAGAQDRAHAGEQAGAQASLEQTGVWLPNPLLRSASPPGRRAARPGPPCHGLQRHRPASLCAKTTPPCSSVLLPPSSPHSPHTPSRSVSRGKQVPPWQPV